MKGQIWICLFLRFLDPVLHSDHLCKRAEMLATLLALAVSERVMNSRKRCTVLPNFFWDQSLKAQYKGELNRI